MSLIEKLEAIKKRYGVIIRSRIDDWYVELFDGDPCVANGVGEVTGWVEYHGHAATIEEALDIAIRKEKEGLTWKKETQHISDMFRDFEEEMAEK